MRRFAVEPTDAGLAAQTQVTIDVGEQPRLEDYFPALADDGRGWDGTRHWRSIEGELLLDATHDGVRRVHLGVTLRPERDAFSPTAWSARCVSKIKPGARLADTADRIAVALLAS